MGGSGQGHTSERDERAVGAAYAPTVTPGAVQVYKGGFWDASYGRPHPFFVVGVLGSGRVRISDENGDVLRTRPRAPRRRVERLGRSLASSRSYVNDQG